MQIEYPRHPNPIIRGLIAAKIDRAIAQVNAEFNIPPSGKKVSEFWLSTTPAHAGARATHTGSSSTPDGDSTHKGA